MVRNTAEEMHSTGGWYQVRAGGESLSRAVRPQVCVWSRGCERSAYCQVPNLKTQAANQRLFLWTV